MAGLGEDQINQAMLEQAAARALASEVSLRHYLEREIANLQQQIDQRFLAATAILEARLDAMDAADRLLHENVTRIPTDVDKAVGHLRELHDVAIRNVEVVSNRRFEDNQQALTAAFAAAKEAAGKSEASTTKELDALKLLIGATNSAFDDKITDLRASRDQFTGHSGGIRDAGQAAYYIFAIAVAVLAILVAHFLH